MTINPAFKIIVLGGQGVGKTSLVARYLDNSSPSCYMATVGIDYRVKTVKNNGQSTRVHLVSGEGKGSAT